MRLQYSKPFDQPPEPATLTLLALVVAPWHLAHIFPSDATSDTQSSAPGRQRQDVRRSLKG